MGPAGATAVGARKVLVAFNVHLRTADVRVAQAIARSIRASSGGLPGVQALGLALSSPGVAQVSMNLTDLDRTSIPMALAVVRAEAARHGVEVGDSELVGLLPAEAALEAAAGALGLPDLKPRQVIEMARLMKSSTAAPCLRNSGLETISNGSLVSFSISAWTQKLTRPRLMSNSSAIRR